MGKTVSPQGRQPSPTLSAGVGGTGQFALDLEPNLLEQYPEFMDVVRASVYSCGRQMKAIAFEMNMTEEKLSKLVAYKDPRETETDPNRKGRELYLRALPDLIRATGDTRPLQWLVLKFMRDPEEHKRQAMAQLAQLMPVLTRLAAVVGN